VLECSEYGFKDVEDVIPSARLNSTQTAFSPERSEGQVSLAERAVLDPSGSIHPPQTE
jgi:hypothetical protein